VPASRWDAEAYYSADEEALGKTYTKRGSFLKEVAGFDAGFFGITPREAKAMDPQHRLLLETSWEALEDGGVVPRELRDSRTGIFVGIGESEYARLSSRLGRSQRVYGAGDGSRVFSGATVVRAGFAGAESGAGHGVQLLVVALHLACQSLRAGECGLALAGGVSLMLSPVGFVYLSRSRALARDGRCKTFRRRRMGTEEEKAAEWWC
jgi:acyl transferase domain-containing protein